VLGLSVLRSLFTGSTTRRSRPRLSADRAGRFSACIISERLLSLIAAAPWRLTPHQPVNRLACLPGLPALPQARSDRRISLGFTVARTGNPRFEAMASRNCMLGCSTASLTEYGWDQPFGRLTGQATILAGVKPPLLNSRSYSCQWPAPPI
jgi:hypothetical protein